MLTDKLQESPALAYWVVGCGVFLLSLMAVLRAEEWLDTKVKDKVTVSERVVSIQLQGLTSLVMELQGDVRRQSERQKDEMVHLRSLIESHMLDGKNGNH